MHLDRTTKSGVVEILLGYFETDGVIEAGLSAAGAAESMTRVLGIEDVVCVDRHGMRFVFNVPEALRNPTSRGTGRWLMAQLREALKTARSPVPNG